MAYNTKYQSHFTSLLSENYELFFDFKDYVGNASELIVSDVSERSVAGDENRLEPILGKELLISIQVGMNDQADISDLVAAHDNDIRITLNLVRADSSRCMVFQGFVVVEDNNQPLQDKPFHLQIRALDGLGHLKGVDLVDQNKVPFTGAMTIIEWIANILYKTNQTLPIRIYFNFFPANLLEQDCFDQVALHIATFSTGELTASTDPSADINAQVFNDAFTALEKIIRNFRCRIFMEDGRWNVVHLWEFMNPNGYGYTEYAILDPVSGICPVAITMRETGIFYDSPIGKEQIIYPFKSDANLYLKLATKWIKLTYTYDQSINKICNQNLANPAVLTSPLPAHNEDISSTVIDPSIVPAVIFHTFGYDDFCYQHLNGDASPGKSWAYPSSPADKESFIRIVRDALGYELYRFLVIPTTVANEGMTYLRTTRIIIDQNDVVQLTYSFRPRNGPQAQLAGQVFIFLYGIDGSFWALRSAEGSNFNTANPNAWVSVDSNFQVPGGGSPAVIWVYSGDFHNWQTASINQNPQFFAKTPVSGSVEILFTAFQAGGTDALEFWYKQISISIVPFLQGTYRELKGDYNFSEIADNIKQTEADDVEISDSPKRYFKGALLENDLQTLLAPDWHRKGISESFRFTRGQERLMWNLLRRIVYKIEGTFKGRLYLDENLQPRPNGFINTYYFVDTNFPTKKFICTSYDRSVTEGTGRHVFVEVVKDQNSDPFIDPSIPPNTFKFDYILQ